MMTKRKSSSVRLLSALVLPCASVAAVSALSLPAVAGMLADVRASSLKPQINGEFTENISDRQIPTIGDAVSAESADAVAPKDALPEAEVEPVITEQVEAVKEIAGDKNSSVKEVYFIDDVLSDAKAVESLDPNSIKSITVVKNDPAYPQGKVLIFTENQTSEHVYTAVEKMAEYKGGQQALMEFLMQNIKYPEGLTKDCRVIVSFKVGKEGEVSDFKVLRSGGEAADAEAVRVVSLTSGNWQPGYVDGKPVTSRFTLPVTFRKK